MEASQSLKRMKGLAVFFAFGWLSASLVQAQPPAGSVPPSGQASTIREAMPQTRSEISGIVADLERTGIALAVAEAESRLPGSEFRLQKARLRISVLLEGQAILKNRLAALQNDSAPPVPTEQQRRVLDDLEEVLREMEREMSASRPRQPRGYPSGSYGNDRAQHGQPGESSRFYSEPGAGRPPHPNPAGQRPEMAGNPYRSSVYPPTPDPYSIRPREAWGAAAGSHGRFTSRLGRLEEILAYPSPTTVKLALNELATLLELRAPDSAATLRILAALNDRLSDPVGDPSGPALAELARLMRSRRPGARSSLSGFAQLGSVLSEPADGDLVERVLESVASLVDSRSSKSAVLLKGFAELSAALEGPPEDVERRTLDELASLFQAREAPGTAIVLRGLAGLSGALRDSAGDPSTALAQLADLFQASDSSAAQTISGFSALSKVLKSKDENAGTQALGELADLLEPHNPEAASSCRKFANVSALILQQQEAGARLVLEEMAELFGSHQPQIAMDLRNHAVLSAASHGTVQPRIQKAMRKAAKSLRKKNPEVAQALLQLGGSKDSPSGKKTQGGFFRSLAFNTAAVIFDEKRPEFAIYARQMAEGKDPKQLAFQVAADVLKDKNPELSQFAQELANAFSEADAGSAVSGMGPELAKMTKIAAGVQGGDPQQILDDLAKAFAGQSPELAEVLRLVASMTAAARESQQ